MVTSLGPRTLRISRRAVLAFALALVLASGAGLLLAAEPKPSVTLIVDYGDGASIHLKDLKWTAGMTAFDALVAARAHRHGITFTQKGTGRSTLVTKIGDLANEGSGKNWLYYVNDKPGEESAAIHEIKADDTVLWKFQQYDYNP
jgi:hypothetical protein